MNPSASNEPRRRPLSADDFDSPAVEHRFSDSYQQRRAALVAEFGTAAFSKSARFKWRVAALAAAALIVVPVTAWAVADNAGFFAGAFGNSGRASVESHDEVQGYKDGKPFMATYPSREYVDVDLDAAERLLGAYTANQETPVSVGDHTLTILSAVRDKDAMVVHYTLDGAAVGRGEQPGKGRLPALRTAVFLALFPRQGCRPAERGAGAVEKRAHARRRGRARGL